MDLSPRRQLIELLDATLTKPLDNDLPQMCWQMDDDRSMIIQTVLEWSTSSHRPGRAKMYVAARILRFCSRSGADITEATLDFLDSKNCESGRNKPAFYHLVSELARSDHFSTARYIQWLIARGGIYDPADVSRDGPCATRLLAELPTHNLSESMAVLRRTLLARADFSVDDEEDQANACIHLMNNSLPGMQASLDFELDFGVADGRDLERLYFEMSRSSKSEIGQWLRQKVRVQMLQPTIPPLDEWDASPIKRGTSAITGSDFNTVRKYLEKVQDYSMLADVLQLVTTSNDPEVLASCADTLDLHLDTFAAIGALDGLFETLMARLRLFTDEVDSIPRVFLVALSDLAARMPDQKVVAQQLARELDLSDRKTAADACSPVSDHMAIVQTAEADFTDEIEKVLASGNSMDQSTLERLFQRIALRLEESWMKLPEQHRSCGLLFTRLRTFDAQQFDLLMTSWVNRFIQMSDRPSMMHVLGPLISFGCLTLKDVVINGGTFLETSASSDAVKGTIARELLSLATAPLDLPEVMTVEETYRLCIKQSHLQSDNPIDTLTVIRRALENPSVVADNPLLPALGSRDPTLFKLLQRLVLVNTDAVTKTLVLPLLQTGNEEIGATIVAIVDNLLAADRYQERTKPIAIEMVLDIADDFTLPFCQVKLASMLAREDANMTDTEEDGSKRSEALDNAIETAVATQNTSWICIVPLLHGSIAQHVRQSAETQFLAVLSNVTALGSEEGLRDRIEQAESLLYIVEATAYSISPSSTANSLAPEIASTLTNLWQLLSSVKIATVKDSLVTKWIPLLLSFTTLQASVFDSTKSGSEARGKVVIALAAMLLELQTLDKSKESAALLVEQAFDLALYLVDSLPDDARQQCINGLHDTVSNPRIAYLLSHGVNPSDWLFLSQREKSPPIPAGLSGPEARAATALEKEKVTPFALRRWEMLGEPTPNVGENDTSLSLTLFGARRG